MPQRQTHYKRRTNNQLGIGLVYFVIIFFGLLIAMVMLCALSNLLNSSSPSDQFFGSIFTLGLIASPIAYFTWRNNKIKDEKQRMFYWQQEQAQQQRMQQEQARQRWVQQEQIRQQQLQEQARQQQLQEQIRQQQLQEQIRQRQLQEQARQRQLQEQARQQQLQEREKVARLKSLNDILVLTPRDFEKLTGKILEQVGGLHNVQHTGGSGDLGADLIGLDSQNNKVIIQCKRYAPGNTIGSPIIQTFIGMIHIHHEVQKGIFVTTSKFTQPAIKLANKHNILLIDGDRIVKLVQEMQTNQ